MLLHIQEAEDRNGPDDIFTLTGKDGELTLVKCDPSASGTIVVPEGVTRIKDGAFQNCRARISIVLPESYGNIWFKQNNRWTPEGYTAPLKGCRNLKSIVFPQNARAVPDSFFYDCSIAHIVIPKQIVEISINAFYYAHNIESITIENKTTLDKWLSHIVDVVFPKNTLNNHRQYERCDDYWVREYAKNITSANVYINIDLPDSDCLINGTPLWERFIPYIQEALAERNISYNEFENMLNSKIKYSHGEYYSEPHILSVKIPAKLRRLESYEIENYIMDSGILSQYSKDMEMGYEVKECGECLWVYNVEEKEAQKLCNKVYKFLLDFVKSLFG